MHSMKEVLLRCQKLWLYGAELEMISLPATFEPFGPVAQCNWLCLSLLYPVSLMLRDLGYNKRMDKSGDEDFLMQIYFKWSHWWLRDWMWWKRRSWCLDSRRDIQATNNPNIPLPSPDTPPGVLVMKNLRLRRSGSKVLTKNVILKLFWDTANWRTDYKWMMNANNIYERKNLVRILMIGDFVPRYLSDISTVVVYYWINSFKKEIITTIWQKQKKFTLSVCQPVCPSVSLFNHKYII